MHNAGTLRATWGHLCPAAFLVTAAEKLKPNCENLKLYFKLSRYCLDLEYFIRKHWNHEISELFFTLNGENCDFGIKTVLIRSARILIFSAQRRCPLINDFLICAERTKLNRANAKVNRANAKVNRCVRVCVCACLHVFACVYMCASLYVCAFMYVGACVHVCVCVRVWIFY